MMAADRYPVGKESPWGDRGGIMRVCVQYRGNALPAKSRPEILQDIRKRLHPQFKHAWQTEHALMELDSIRCVVRDGRISAQIKKHQGAWYIMSHEGEAQGWLGPMGTSEKCVRRALWYLGELTKEDHLTANLSELRSVRIVTGSEAIATDYRLGSFDYAPIVMNSFHLRCHLDVTLYRRMPPGGIFAKSKETDLDNTLKVFFDALKIPDRDQVVPNTYPDANEVPLYVLLEDDSLITSVRIASKQLLDRPNDGEKDSDVLIVAEATIRPWKVTDINRDFLAEYL